jgi:hypothetical protein
MDWAKAIRINREALTRIVAGLVSLLAAQGGAARLPLPVYELIAKVLYPAESAVRRLLVIAARGLVVEVPVVRPMPAGHVIERKNPKGTGRITFQLYDTRKHFSHIDEADRAPISGPRIRSVSDADPRSLFLAQFNTRQPQTTSSEIETRRLQNRLLAVQRALDHLPRQAKRMAIWLKRRALMTRPKFKSPLRPGAPPGHRKRSKDEINLLLVECHALAWDALRPNTS